MDADQVVEAPWRPVVLPPAPPASSEAVRRVLQGNGRRDTAPELSLRRELHALGLRFLVDATPAGTPRRRRADVVVRGSRIAVHLHGCFWHRCPEHFHPPKANAEWWRAKFTSVVDRDANTGRQLRGAGLPVVVWQHEDMGEAALASRSSMPTGGAGWARRQVEGSADRLRSRCAAGFSASAQPSARPADRRAPPARPVRPGQARERPLRRPRPPRCPPSPSAGRRAP